MNNFRLRKQDNLINTDEQKIGFYFVNEFLIEKLLTKRTNKTCYAFQCSI